MPRGLLLVGLGSVKLTVSINTHPLSSIWICTFSEVSCTQCRPFLFLWCWTVATELSCSAWGQVSLK